MLDEERRVYIPIEEITTPKEGYIVHLDRWWNTKNNCVVFYKSDSGLWNRGGYELRPQCNVSRPIMEQTSKTAFPDCELTFLPLSYLKE